MAKEAKKEAAPDTSKDDSFLGGLCELGNSLGDMILSPLEEAVTEVTKQSKPDDKVTPEVKPKGSENGNGNGSGSERNISINLGGFFQSERPASAAKKKGKAPRVEEPADDESDDSAE